MSHVDEVTSNSPIVTVTKYESVNELDKTLQNVTQKEKELGTMPVELLIIIQDSLFYMRLLLVFLKEQKTSS